MKYITIRKLDEKVTCVSDNKQQFDKKLFDVKKVKVDIKKIKEAKSVWFKDNKINIKSYGI